jgi:hypothetical protein
MKKNVVYTALFGNYDYLIEPSEVFDDCDFICFTDQIDLKSDIWEIRQISSDELPNNLMNRKFKILPHKYLTEYQFSLYLDANIYLKGDPNLLIQKYLEKDILAIPRHPWRTCVFEEASECIIAGKSSYLETSKQMKKYERLGLPLNYGLSENSIMLRRHNDPLLIELMEQWWKELNSEAQRDQLSLPFVLWEKNLFYNYIVESARTKNDYFEWLPHKASLDTNLFKKITVDFKVAMRRHVSARLFALK